MSRPAPLARIPPLVLLALIAPACGGPTVPLAQTVRVDEVVTGWFDAGVTEDGKNKIVPSVSLKLTNIGAAQTGSVQLNCIFKRVGDSDEWSTALVSAVDRSGLAPGTTSRPIVVRATQGYTGLQPRGQLLENKYFIDAKVEIFGKHGSTTWVKLGDFRIDRQLLTQ